MNAKALTAITNLIKVMLKAEKPNYERIAQLQIEAERFLSN